MPLVGAIPPDLVPWWWCGVAFLFVLFAFLQVGVLSGERYLGETLAFNFQCWKSGGHAALWFIVIALVNLCVFALAEVTVGRALPAGSFPAIVLKIAFVFLRCFVLVWLAGAWLLMFCERFIGAKKPRLK